MSDKTRLAAIVPMRHDSERVPGKNYRLFGGRPLYHHIVTSLLACPAVSQVVLDTDSPVIIEDAAAEFPTVCVLRRPAHLTAGDVPMNDVLLNSVNQVHAELYLQTHSTNPLLTPGTIERAITQFRSNSLTHDSLFSVTRYQVRLWDANTRPLNHDPAVLLRTQDLPPVYAENSCLYLFTRELLESRRNRIGHRPLMFEMNPLEALDIDEEHDFTIAELAYADRGRP